MALCAQTLYEADPARNHRHLDMALRWYGLATSFAHDKSKSLFTLMGHLAELRRALLISGAGLEGDSGPGVEGERQCNSGRGSRAGNGGSGTW